MGWPDIYDRCFSQLEGDKDSFPLDGIFLPLSTSDLIRDIEGAVY